MDQAFGQGGKLGAAELSLGIELIDEPHHARLFFGREASNLVDDLRRGDGTKLMRDLSANEPGCDARRLRRRLGLI